MIKSRIYRVRLYFGKWNLTFIFSNNCVITHCARTRHNWRLFIFFKKQSLLSDALDVYSIRTCTKRKNFCIFLILVLEFSQITKTPTTVDVTWIYTLQPSPIWRALYLVSPQHHLKDRLSFTLMKTFTIAQHIDLHLPEPYKQYLSVPYHCSLVTVQASPQLQAKRAVRRRLPFLVWDEVWKPQKLTPYVSPCCLSTHT